MDAVITYVDGADPNHRQKMARFFDASGPDFDADRFKERFVSGDEIRLCVQSIGKFAPWVKNIFIVTDNQDPLEKFPDLKAGNINIQIVDHTVIFRDHTSALPSFNSNAIGSLLWKIPGLSNHFIYFNDDTMLCNPVEKTDFVRDGKPVIYFSSRRNARKRDPLTFERYHYTINAQKIVNRFFVKSPGHLPAHLPMVFCKKTFETIAALAPEEILENIHIRIRGDMRKGFAPSMLHHNWHKAAGTAVVSYDKVGVVFSGTETQQELDQKEALFQSGTTKFACVNNWGLLETRHPHLATMIRARVAVG